jgi:hypothetical protein
MNRQICQSCQSEVLDDFNEPLTFCTNCGARLSVQPPNLILSGYATAGSTTGGRKKYSGKEKFAFWAIISIPVLLILGTIGVVVLFVAAIGNIENNNRRYPTPTPYMTPKRLTNTPKY